MYHNCLDHDCEHCRLFLAIFDIFCQMCTPFSPHKQAKQMTNGPFMACCLCIPVLIAPIPCGWTEAPTHQELAEGECAQFCHFRTCGLDEGHHHPMTQRDLWHTSISGPRPSSDWVPHPMLCPISGPSGRNTPGDTFIFGSSFGVPNHPFWDPNLSPQWGPLVAQLHLAHKDPRPNSKSRTWI